MGKSEMSNFDYITGRSEPDTCIHQDNDTDESPAFDPEAFTALAREFGGIAGGCIKKNPGGWSPEGWEDAMATVYEHRHLLNGVEGEKERGDVVYGILNQANQLRRIEAILQNRREQRL
jgi:hypothetical protein